VDAHESKHDSLIRLIRGTRGGHGSDGGLEEAAAVEGWHVSISFGEGLNGGCFAADWCQHTAALAQRPEYFIICILAIYEAVLDNQGLGLAEQHVNHQLY
jgi:hypothetical protein